MKKIFFAATMALALTCVSCYDDKGNYDYTDLEVVEVEKPGDNILEKYIISRFDTLTIDPKVTYQGKQVVGDEAPLDYLWTLYTTHTGVGVDYTIDTLSTSRKLDAQITRGGGDYALHLTVRNRNDGVEYYMQTQLTIEESISAGWLLLYECADAPGQSDVGLVVNEWTKNNIIKNREFWDLYKASNNRHLNGEPRCIHHTVANLAQGDIVMIFTNKEYAGVSHNTFEKNTAFGNLFYEEPANYDFNYYGPAGAAALGETLVNDNKVYVTSFMGSRNNFFGVAKSGDYGKLANWASATRAASYDAVVYDQTNQRFLVAPRSGVSFTSFAAQAPTAAFDVNNVGMELWMGDFGGAMFNDFLFFKKGSEYYLAEANFGLTSNINLPNLGTGLYNITASPGIANATTMAAAMQGQYVLYGSGNKVYNLAYNQSTTATTLWTAPDSGEEVTCIALQKFYYRVIAMAGILPYANRILHIATWNESKKEGKFYEYEINPASGALLGEPKVYTVPGKVKSMCWKYAMER